MRYVAPLFGLLAAFILTAAPAHADDKDWSLEAWKNRQDEWAGYGVGTMVHTKSTQVMSMPQMPEPRTTITETKKTLMAISENEYTVKTETKVGEQWMANEIKVPRKNPKTTEFKQEKIGDGTVKVDGTDYACTRWRVTVTAKGAPSTVTVVWVHDTKGALQIESETDDGMGGKNKVVMKATRLGVEKTVAGHDMSCREFSWKSSGGEFKMLMTRDAPTSMVSMDMTMKQPGMDMHNKVELVGMTIKKAATTTPAAK